jgi:TRAF3-interacting protein 1
MIPKKIMNAPSNGGNDNASSNTNSNNDSNNGNDSNGRPGNNSQQPQRGNKGGNANDGNGGINENIPEANADDQIDMAIEQEAVVSHIIANSRYRERPASARPPPPKQRHSNIIQDTPVKVATPIVIQETSQQQDEEEENEYFIINQDNQEMNKPILSHDDTKGNDHFGGLVQHILDTKKDLEGGDSNEKDSSLKLTANENESKDMIHAKKDINSLRESIQFLCRNTNPLGKTMDYIQEDFDSMIKELEGWKSESVKYSDLLKTELETTKETLKPLQEQLREVEQNIAEELERINSQNATIIRNKEKIDKLLQSIVHPVR